MIRNSAPVLVAATLVRLQGARVARQRALEVALNVREDAQVLLDACPQLPARAPQLHRAQKVTPRIGQCAGLEVDPAEGIQGLGREHVVARSPGLDQAPPAPTGYGGAGPPRAAAALPPAPPARPCARPR